MNELFLTNCNGETNGYHSPEIEVLYCGADAPLLDSPSAGFDDGEGGLIIDDLD